MAADILVTLKDERQIPLHSVESDLTLVFFFDPDCERCRLLDLQLSQEPLLLQNPRLAVVRVMADRLTSAYYVPHFPSLYLLDAEKRVVLKDAPLSAVLQSLEEASPYPPN